MKPNYKKRFISTITKLVEDYPSQTLGVHLSFIFSEYPRFEDIEGLSDKEITFLLEKYKCEKDLDFSPVHRESEIDKIIREGQDLNHILDEDDEEGEEEDF